ncbi:MAG: NAD(P)-binding domain-containing protein [Candidatus Lightella neohaematopini]|nr:NAD(P)-binding domain-containing protein [Candidatus Lightella neohaematopini]
MNKYNIGEKKINVIGAGNISYALVSGLINSNYKKDLITVCAPSIKNRNNITKLFGIKNSSSNIHYSDQADVLILAVKPQSIISVCHDLNKINLSKKIIISLLAGINTNILISLLKQNNINIIRIMPNIAIAVNYGIIAMYTISKDINNINFTKNLFSKMGVIYQLDNENDIDIFTVIVGSSPAYFLFFMEEIQKKIESMGINKCNAYNIIINTINGIVYLSKLNHHTKFSKLRESISSKKGITESAISVFKKENISSIIANAIDASMNRIKDLKNIKIF